MGTVMRVNSCGIIRPMEEQQEQPTNSKVPKQLLPHIFTKGKSGNPAGRPPGRSLKDRAKAYLSGMTDEEAIDFWEGMNKKDVWEMAEGKAEAKTQIDAKVEHTLAPEQQEAISKALDDV